MKKIILLTTGIVLFSCSTEEITDDQNLIDEIETLAIDEEVNSEKNDSITSKDTDNDGINDDADADVDGDGTIDNGTDSDGDGINDSADVDNDNDGIEDNGTDIDNDGINDEYDDDIDGDGISNDDDEYQSLSDTDFSSSVQKKIAAYISSNYPNDTITEVEIENQIIEVELSGNTELSFDLNGNFLSTESENDHDNDDSDHNNSDDDSQNEYSSLSSSGLSQEVQKKIADYIGSNYPNDTVTEVEIENQIIEVELSGNTELSFDLNGNFLSTESENDHDNDDSDHNNSDDDSQNEYSSLSSSGLSQEVQKKIADYIGSNYPNDTVTEVEIENQKIEVELSSDIELIFDLNGNFIRLDD
ncbi:MAG: PepSY-like domain-containing protein [Flavobacteriaceae bacterium]